MRTIKFRAWNGAFWLNLGEDALVSIAASQKLGIVFQQFTGLFDKNGKEIYEGDVVKIDNSLIAKVIFHQRYASFEVATTGNSIGFYSPMSIEVIGNIYENKELVR